MTTSSYTPSETILGSWFRALDQQPDLPSRLVGIRTIPFDERDDIEAWVQKRGGPRSSLLGRVGSEDTMSTLSTTATGAIPALTHGTSSGSSAGSADTGLASALDGGYVLESRDGMLTLPNRFQPNADLLCPFQILDCDEVFSEIREFKMHVFSHFNGYDAPAYASCFLCDLKFTEGPEDRGARAWNEMLSHLANAHFRQGERLATVRTDFVLMRWMYSKKIITDAQFKRTQLCAVPVLLPVAAEGPGGNVVSLPSAPAPPSAPHTPFNVPPRLSVGLQNEAYFVHASRRSERRRREATRPMVATRGHL